MKSEEHILNGKLLSQLPKMSFFSLHSIFLTMPNYMLSDADVYSIEDLENVRKGELFRIIAPLVEYGQYHIEGCEVNLIPIYSLFFLVPFNLY